MGMDKWFLHTLYDICNYVLAKGVPGIIFMNIGNQSEKIWKDPRHFAVMALKHKSGSHVLIDIHGVDHF